MRSFGSAGQLARAMAKGNDLKSVLFFIPMLAFVVFMLVVTNIKNPGRRIQKIQSQLFL